MRMTIKMKLGATAMDSRIAVIQDDIADVSALLGLRANKGHEVTSLEVADTEGGPRVGQRWRADFIRCLARRDGDLIVVPDLDQIFSSKGGVTGAVVQLSAA